MSLLRNVEPIVIVFDDDGDIPNSKLPLLYYPEIVDSPSAEIFERLFAENGWPDSWRNGVFPFPHYHSNAHEVLGCYQGEANVRLGGINGRVQKVSAGDVVILPAGVGHENLGTSNGFAVVGSYPAGQSPDLCRGGERPPEVLDGIASVPLPSSDPALGEARGLCVHW